MLEATVDEWQDWLRCPSCGKASRPPYQRRARVEPVEDVLYIGTFTTGPWTAATNGTAPATNGTVPPRVPSGWPTAPGAPPWADVPAQTSGTLKRALIGGGLLLSIVLALISVAQKNPTQAGVFGFVAFLLTVFLIQSSRQP
jgi:hypothetical protein